MDPQQSTTQLEKSPPRRNPGKKTVQVIQLSSQHKQSTKQSVSESANKPLTVAAVKPFAPPNTLSQPIPQVFHQPK